MQAHFPTLMKLNIALSDRSRSGVAALLKALLADVFVLYTKTRKFHWNVTGPHFTELHKLFETQYDALAEEIDEVAERIRSLGSMAPGSLREFSKLARLKESLKDDLDANDMLAAVLADHEALVRHLRSAVTTCEKLGDDGTADFLTGLMEAHEKTAWMLRATLDR